MKLAYRWLALASLLLAPLTVGACAGVNNFVPPIDVAKAMDGGVVEAYDRFAFKLLQELAGAEPGENVFISPTSVAFALSMVYNGADGETREAIAQALGVEGISMDALNESNAAWLAWLGSDDPKVELALANSTWAREGLPVSEDFLDRNRRYYEAQIESLDFDRPDAADVINAWVNDQTRERIPEIIEGPISGDTIMFLINALYFKGEWATQFEEARTRQEPFTLPDGTILQVPMMSRMGDVLYQEGDGFRAMSLPYGDGRFTMDVLLPDEGSNVATLVEWLDADRWGEITAGFVAREVALSLPRFTLEYEKSLKQALSALGMGIAFDASRADLSGILEGGPRKYIHDVKHKTFLEVNEEGSEAAAVTSVEVRVTSAGPEPLRFTVDRPFVVTIRDTASGTILFIGAITDPGT